MSKRLQVIVPDLELLEIRRFARREHLTAGEWVRRTLRNARLDQSATDPAKKLKAVRRAVEHSFPAPGIEQMLAEIERGYDA
jgi:hypothetical protein